MQGYCKCSTEHGTGLDVVLCSSDGVEFHVFRWILEDSSPIFTDMFQLPTDTTGKVQTVDLTETSDTLKRLLELHYPLPPQPQFASFEDAKPILVAADKYQLSKVAPALALAALPRIRVNPLRAYAFAVRHNMLELIRLSAKEFLQVSYMAVYSEELEDITAGAYLRLLAYRKACAASLEGLIASNWYPSTCASCTTHSPSCSRNKPRGHCYCTLAASWFTTYWEHVRELLSTTPSHEVIKNLGDTPIMRCIGIARDSVSVLTM
ncbi:hypothetical protein L226DRAFT_546611 [Lentinus tigrinus ALCF2SS1-7]|uniref:uncharacterized protein n=1 Tax=Lentinus tigrinus ALCF2SS1-7 TaxID=1328758 RepID=UPI0011663C1C|nr:hypothetical protein L226DRAFT_546611 [Lentinus tigrinus ALCF2SS1-7]